MRFLRRGRPDRVFALAPGGRVDQADDRQAASMHVAATLVAGDTGAYFRQPAFAGFHREFRIGMQRAPERDEVAGAGFEQVFGDAGVGQPAGDADRHFDVLADLACQRGEHALRHLHRLGDPPIGLVHAGRNVDQVHTRCHQVRRDRADIGEREAVLLVLVAADPEQHRHFGPDGPAHGRDHRERKTHAAGQIAAVFVFTLVAVGRQELAEQVAVRAVNADEIAARLRGPPRRRGEGVDQFGDAVAVQRPRRPAAGADVRHDRRGA